MQSILDNLRQIARVDKGRMLDAIYRSADPFLDPPRFKVRRLVRSRAYNAIVLAGMGGSASAADTLMDWLRDEIVKPVMVPREAGIPKFADKNTMVVCFSYSGETWETLRSFDDAWKRRCRLAAIGSGGRLGRVCGERGVPFFQVKSGLAPRAALGEMVVAGSSALQYMGLVSGIRKRLLLAGRGMVELREKIKPEIPSSGNGAKEFALLLKDKLPVIYGFHRMSSVARRFKNQLAENSKTGAKYSLLPEACHNEVESWKNADKSLLPIIIRDSRESQQEAAVAEAFRSTIEKTGRTRPFEVRIPAKSTLGRLLSPILFLDYVSVYLALLMNVDPSPTPWIREYKRRLTKRKTPQ